MNTKAAVINETGGKFNIEDIKIDQDLGPNDILVKVVATGICHTDLIMRDDFFPFLKPAVFGHEGSGIVEKIGSAVTKVSTGDHVVMAPASCGECENCVEGHPSYCLNFMELNFGGHQHEGTCPYHNHDGKEMGSGFFGQSSFANYSLVKENNVVKVDKDIPLELLGPLGCGFQTGSGTVLNFLKARPGDSIVVAGVGAVGLSAIMAAKLAGCTTIVAADIHDSRLELAKELGATHTINSKDQKISDYVLSEIAPKGLKYGLDTTGRNNVISDAMSALKIKGHMAIVLVAADKLELDATAIQSGKSISFVNEGDSNPDVYIPNLIKLYKAGLFPFDKLVKYYDFKEFNKAVEDTEKGSTIKAIIKMPS
ncbi:NAD(P)-dependent alcohol dehydrogenase [Fulvivirga sediminis]|uniref:NAD(P)-dependent alcohol dehydrogenase n=1 Tax=Fulvivirga sediminis TaxID=2803949 RepID=A0A937FAZ6_9BACT|nr:NAD(P)-dependent alcohol dehydrogenase [Fulvivirga sediminis]MBL3657268.1 NAD(P)-dependent alcohol dehydrogenase [Fulvivirga sediminis]